MTGINDTYDPANHALAAGFESEWLDLVMERQSGSLDSRFPPLSVDSIRSSFYPRVASLISGAVDAAGASPETMVEVGAGQGRTAFEIIRAHPSVRKAHLIEPSAGLRGHLHRMLLDGAVHDFRYIRGLHAAEDGVLTVDTAPFVHTVQHVDIRTWAAPAEDCAEVPSVDLVVCLNVVDHCRSPDAILDFVKERTTPGGFAAVSCTYQWPREYDPNSCALHTDVSSVFHEGWRKAAEDELEYKFRINERHWVFYMTHVVVMQKDA